MSVAEPRFWSRFFAGRHQPAMSVAQARQQIAEVVPNPRMEARSKLQVIAEIRRDLLHIRKTHAEVASLSEHPGWLWLMEYMKHEVDRRMAGWRGRHLRGEYAEIDCAIIFEEFYNALIAGHAPHAREFNEASALLADTPAEMVQNVLRSNGDHDAEEETDLIEQEGNRV